MRGFGMATGRPSDARRPEFHRESDDDVRRWLAGRLDEDGPDLRIPTDEEPTDHGRRPPAVGAFRDPSSRLSRALADEDPDAHETVLDGSLEDDEPRTVRMDRRRYLPEVVADDETVRAEAWSMAEGPLDEVPLRQRTPTPPPRRTRSFQPPLAEPSGPIPATSSLSPQIAPPADAPGRTFVPVLIAVAIGVALGLVGATFVLWLAV